MSKTQKRFLLFASIVLIFALAFLAYFLYEKSQVLPEPMPEVTQESIARELENFVPDPKTVRNPEVIKQELESYVPPPEKKISDEVILEELNNPAIEPLPANYR